MNLKVLLLLLLTCSGCSLVGNKPYVPETKAVEVVTITKPAAVYHPPLPNKVKTKPVEWKVLTPQIMDEYLTDLKKVTLLLMYTTESVLQGMKTFRLIWRSLNVISDKCFL